MCTVAGPIAMMGWTTNIHQTKTRHFPPVRSGLRSGQAEKVEVQGSVFKQLNIELTDDVQVMQTVFIQRHNTMGDRRVMVTICFFEAMIIPESVVKYRVGSSLIKLSACIMIK